MKKTLLMLTAILLFAPAIAGADLVEEDPVMDDNTGALGVSTDATTSVDIINEQEASGVKDGEITLKLTSGVGVEVYSGLAKVESIPEGSDGWTGAFVVEMGEIRYTPAGRPQLTCPSQSLSGWYGPCKIAEAASE